MPRLMDLMAGDALTPTTELAAPPESTGVSITSLIGGPPKPVTQEPVAPAGGPPTGLRGIAQDIFEGVTAPFTGDYHAMRAILADPAIRILPPSIQDEEARKAEELGWKGAAFWGSALAGGGVGGVAAKAGLNALAKGAIIGGIGGGTFQAIRDLPDVFHGKIERGQAMRDIATTSVFTSLTGGVLSQIPGGARLGVKGVAATGRGMMNVANRSIDAIPGGANLRDKVGGFISTSFANVWDKFFTSGIEILNKAGLGALGQQLHAARTTSTMMGGKWVADHVDNFKGLNRDQVRQVATIMQKFANGEIPEAGIFDMRLMTIAEKEANRLRDVGRLFQKHGVQVYDPERGLHVFVPRKDFAFPHRFVNPNAFRSGSEYYESALKALAKAKPELDDEGRRAWLSTFADRLENELNGVFEGRPVGSTAGSYMKGRTLNLPGFSEDVDQILPQYYEHAARRLTNHIFFGPITPVGQAAEKAVSAITKPAAKAASPVIDKVAKAATEEVLPELAPGQIVFRRNLRAMGELRARQAIEFRYPRAFAQLEAVENPGLKTLSEGILRRQLGAIDLPSAGVGTFLTKAQYLEVITKLALGAIAQPSQILSGIARTQYRGAFKNLIRTIADPDAMDFATRSGVALQGVVRRSEQSLTGGETEFLRRVGFTQLDLMSRRFGALQGESFAEYSANKLAQLAARPSNPVIRNQIAKIETRLIDLGIDPKDVIRQGGILTEDQLLKAANRVSGDVNFWGDALSLPEFFKSPIGRYMTQFKSFSFQQSKLVKDHFVKPALKGDFGPITKFAILTPIGGEIIANVKSMVRAKSRREQEVGERILEDFANGAGFGIVYDAFNATKFGTGGTMGFGLGPSLGGTIPKTATALGEAIRGQPRSLARISIETGLPAAAALTAPQLLPVAAVVAPALSNLLVPKGPRP